MRAESVIALLLVQCGSLILSVHADSETVVTTQVGVLQGAITDDGTARVFRGVPYAQPPLGRTGRWKMPQYVASWTGVRTALQDPPGCMQVCDQPPVTCPGQVSEDCLYLNVFTPRLAGTAATAATETWPVMVFFHGGNFKEGFAGGPLYDARFAANTSGVITVAANYRLGAFGFLHNTNVPAELQGNYGIYDQQMALMWVQHNIAAFGGNPDRVTIFGQSAGAVSVAIHTYLPSSKGLFSQAMMISEPFGIPLRSTYEATLLQQDFAKYAGCAPTDVECLYNKTSADLMAAETQIYSDISIDKRFLEAFMPFAPIIGIADDIPLEPYEAFVAGLPRSYPTVIGNTRAEGTLFVYSAYKNALGPVAYDLLCHVVFNGSTGNAVLEEYPPEPNTKDLRAEASTVTTDSIFLCVNRNASRIYVQTNPNPLYLYVFDHNLTFAGDFLPPFCWNTSCHGSDLPFVFHYGYGEYFNWTADEDALSISMVEYYTNFAQTGNPSLSSITQQRLRDLYSQRNPSAAKFSGPDLVTWPQYSDATGQSMRLATPTTFVDTFFHKEICDFWDSRVGYIWS